MNPTAEAYLVLHRFGSFEKAQNKDQLNTVIQSFQESLRSNINPRNLKRFVDAFLKRSNLNDHCGKVKCGVLMVTGSKASFNHTVHKMYTAFQSKEKKRSELLEVDGVSNVLEEKPDRLAESFQYFVQGIGYAGGVPMPRVRRTSAGEGFKPPIGRNRSLSMEEADQPKGIYSCSPPK